MPRTAAERQAIYRANRTTAGLDGNGERRINTWVSSATYWALRRLSKRHGVSQRAILERLICSEDDAVLATLIIDTPEWSAYFSTK